MMRRLAGLSVLLLVVGGIVPIRAHGADGTAPSAIQSIALEGARQDMLKTQLTEIVSWVEALLADIATNEGVSEGVIASASDMRGRLNAIVQLRLVPARAFLTQAMHDRQKVAPAQQLIELAARDLGSLLLQAGVSQATEVFATELREIIAAQEELQKAAGPPAAAPAADRVAKAQTDLAARVTALTSDLAALRDVPRDPLAAVRLARARKIVEEGEVAASMRRVGRVWTDQPLDAAVLQAAVLRHLRESVLKLRPDARLEELVRARRVAEEIADSQRTLRIAIAGLTAAALEGQKEGLRLEQQRMLIPLEQFGEAIEIDQPLQIATQRGSDAAEALLRGDAQAAMAGQTHVEDAIALVLVKIDGQIDDLSSLGRARRRMLDAAARVKSLTRLQGRAESIRNSAYELELADEDLSGVAATQQQLAQDITRFQSQLGGDGPLGSALGRPLRKAARAGESAAEALRVSNIDDAMPHWFELEETLNEALSTAARELGVLESLWVFSQATADIRVLRSALEDIQAEQADLRADVESAQRDGRTVLDLTDQQSLLTQAAQQVQENVGLIREAVQMDGPVSQAVAAMSRAVDRLGLDQPEQAIESIRQAIAGLQDGRDAASRLITQIELLTAEMNTALQLSGRAREILDRQIDLRETTEEVAVAEFSRLAGEQDVIHAEAMVLTALNVAPKVESAFRLATDEMVAAIGELNVPARGPAVEHEQKAENALREGVKALVDYINSITITIVQGTSSEDMNWVPSWLDGMQGLLILATDQNELRELTSRTPDSLLPSYVDEEAAYQERAVEISKGFNVFTPFEGRIIGWEHIEVAAAEMGKARATLEDRVKDPAITHQQKAEKELRIAFALNVVQMVSELEDFVLVVGGGGTILDVPIPFSPDIWLNFSPNTAKGNDPSGEMKGEWNSLVDRDRSALHENFARELPLEYRKLLKDYYQSLAR